MTKKKQSDTPGLVQIETHNRRREPLDPSKSEAAKTREAKGWIPQSEPSGVQSSDASTG